MFNSVMHEANGYGIYTEVRDFGRDLAIYIVQMRSTFGGPHDILLRFASDGVTTRVPLEEGARLPDQPSLQLPVIAFLPLLETLRQMGQTPYVESKLQGRLEATERHLDDMRRLVGHLHKAQLNLATTFKETS